MDLQNFADKIMPNDHAKFCRAIALTVLQGIVNKTPVRTGLARGNWQVSGGTPPGGPITRLDPSGGAVISSGASAIQAIQPLKSVIWVSNSLPYIERLENGYSQQAPSGMVLLTLEEIKAKAAAL